MDFSAVALDSANKRLLAVVETWLRIAVIWPGVFKDDSFSIAVSGVGSDV